MASEWNEEKKRKLAIITSRHYLAIFSLPTMRVIFKTSGQKEKKYTEETRPKSTNPVEFSFCLNGCEAESIF